MPTLSLSHARIAAVSAICAVLITLLALSFATTADARSARDNVPSGNARCMEDDPCWNWATMGNHTRGVVTVSGRFVVVNPTQLRILVGNGRVNLRTQSMLGDYSALRGATSHTN